MKISRRLLLAASALLPVPRVFAGELAPDELAPGGWSGGLLMATGRPGGAYDVYGPAWGRFAQQLSGIDIAYRASGGAASDILLIEQGAAQLGMTTVTVADQARAGSGGWTAGVKFSGFRALFPMFPSILQIVAPAGRVTAVAGLADQAIGIGPEGSGSAAVIPGILASLGIVPGRFATGDYGAQVHEMFAGGLAACAFIGAPPLPAIQQAAATRQLRLIGFTPAEAAQVVRASPGMVAMTIPAGMFPGQALGIASVGTANFAIGDARLPDALVNTITLAAMRNRAALANLVPAAAMAPEPMLSAPGRMMFHPGAAMALRSLGFEVAERFVEA